MAISCTLTMEGKAYQIKNATARFDRQWDLELSKTEFVRGMMGPCGYQNLCTVTGSYHGNPIQRDIVLEMIDNVCGDAY